VREQVAAAGFVVMQAHHLVAEWTFGIERVEAPSSQKLDEFDSPYG
jgi:hypothetical protein